MGWTQTRQPITWSSHLSIGVPGIDEEHRLLVEAHNDLASAWGSTAEHEVAARAMRDLFAYADYHFRHEEELMRDARYPELGIHRRQHLRFIDMLMALDAHFTAGRAGVLDISDFVGNWLLTHIRFTDRQLGEYLCGEYLFGEYLYGAPPTAAGAAPVGIDAISQVAPLVR